MSTQSTESPFPGMDPYLERYWGDVHATLLVYAKDGLQPLLPSGLYASVQEHVALQSVDDSDDVQSRYPNVSIVEASEAPSTGGVPAGIATTPILLVREIDPSTRRYLAIVDRDRGDRLVTAIEVISPGNKDGERSRMQYCERQGALLAAGVNLVEIDLVRSGGYVLAAPELDVVARESGPYRVSVVRGARPAHVEFYHSGIRESLPTIGIPLRPREHDVTLDLQTMMDRVHDNGGYGARIDYSRDPVPPLDAADAEWADALLKSKGLR